MLGGGVLYAREFECFVSRLVIEIRWLNVCERYELPDLTRDSTPWCLILNTDTKDKPCSHWLALNEPNAGFKELFNLFGFLLINFSLDSLNPLNLNFFL